MPLLRVQDLRIEVDVPDYGWAEAVSGIGFEIERAGSLGVVGESGCGKSLTALSIPGLLPERGVRKAGGEVTFDGRMLTTADDFRAVRGKGIGYVPQDPMTALNPVLPVGEQVAEAVRLHHVVTRSEAIERTVELLRRVGIPSPEERRRAYPHQLSGGQRQRVLIAIALAGDPALLVADEPTTALDVTVQAQVLRLLVRLRRDRAMGLLLVTHDLGVVAQTCERIAILYAGEVVETGPAREILERPAHPYTRGLLASIPGRSAGHRRLTSIPGVVPPVHERPAGCTFQDRCPRKQPRCVSEAPALSEVVAGREAACHFAEVAP